MFIIGERINGMFKDIAQAIREQDPVQYRNGRAGRMRPVPVTSISTPVRQPESD